MAIGSLTIQHRVHTQQLRRDIESFLDSPGEYTRENVIDRMYQLEETYQQLAEIERKYDEETADWIAEPELTEADRALFVGQPYAG